ncbi:MAG: TlpA disulfide reductase family protein [Bacteroidota bacterium]
MKKLLIILLCTLCIDTIAQQKPFKIDGEVIGADTFKYVYAFDNEIKLLKGVEIKDGKFLLEGTYNPVHRFGAQASAALVFSNNNNVNNILNDSPLSYRNPQSCRVIMEEKINLIYDTNKKRFLLDGGSMNKVQNNFELIRSVYLKSIDSAVISRIKNNIGDREQKTVDELRFFNEMTDQVVKVIKEHPDSEASLKNMIVVIVNQSIPAAKVEKTFNLLSDRLKKSEYGIHVRKNVDRRISDEKQLVNPPYTVGMKLPYFEILNTENKLVKSTTAFGKYTLVDFWATWCVPCRQETPNLIIAHKKFKGKGFKIVAISIDEKNAHKKWLEVIDSDKMNEFVNLFNGNDLSGLAKELKITAIPANFLVDSTGRIVAVNLRGEELQNKLKELLP